VTSFLDDKQPTNRTEPLAGAPTAPEPEPRTITSLDKFYNPNGQAAYRSMVESMIDSQPGVAYTAEAIAQDYPTISRDLLASIVMSGMGDKIPAKLLDEMAQRDIAAQEAAADSSWYGTFKGGVRNMFLGAEDLYNVSPLLAMPRLGINLYQGKSVDEATNLAFASSLRNEIRASKMGLETDYGTGFLPSQELVPQGAGFWTKVRESIINGDYEGSAEEQIVAAQLAAQKEQILATGFNPYALARQEWLSTQITRTINGEHMAVPFSPGSSIALWYTTPGTFAYDMFSGSLDASARMTLEPIDVAFDNVGQLFKHFNPAVFSDNVVGINRGGVKWRQMLEDLNIYHPNQPILSSVNQVDDAGHVIKNPILGSTDTRGISPEGVATINVDPKEITRIWEQGIDDLATKSGTEWRDLTNVYARALHDMGLTPNDVRRQMSLEGGENGRYFLTLEHELVHGEIHQLYYELLDEFTGDGTKYIDHAIPSKKAPEELQRIGREMQDKKLSIADFEGPGGYRAELREAVEKADSIDEGVVDLLDQLEGGVKDKARRLALQRELKDAQKASKSAHRIADEYATVHDDLLRQRNLLDTQANEFIEVDAVQTSWKRMKDGKWAAPDLYAQWKRKAGLSKLLRPWLNPKAATEWLQTNMGRRTIERLAKADEFEYVRKHASYLSPEEMAMVTRAVDDGEVAEIIRRSINRHPGELRPTIGIVQDQWAHGLDAWRLRTEFIGGPVAAASKKMGVNLRRAKAGVGANTMSIGSLDDTLDTIYSVGATAHASADEISNLQMKAVRIGREKAGLDELYADLKELSIRDMERMSESVYSTDEIKRIWKEWEGYEEQSRLFWTSNKGRERKVVFRSGKWVKLSNIDEADIRGQAFMEAQFSMSHRTMPDIRRIRRLHSRQRNAWERVRARRQELPGGSDYYEPLGFNKSALMGVGDFSFGIWRDMQLMRGGWALRIIPEEQLRFGASGYSGLFKNPVDYFISLMNRMDFKQPGYEMTLGDIMRMEESLGTAGLRDLRMPAHVVPHDDWGVASFARQPELAWGAFTREFLQDSHDRVVTRVAAMGREEAIAFFKTAEGQEIVKEIAMGASKDSSLALIANPKELIAMIDVVDLRIAQISGGQGIWFDPLKQAWVDLYDTVKHPIPDLPGGAYPNKDVIKAEILDLSDDPAILRGKSGASRAELKTILTEVRGYDLDELEKAKRAAFVTDEGNSEIRAFIHTRELDDMVISDDMSYGAVRELDAQLEAAFVNRGVQPPDYWPVPKTEMEQGAPGLYNKAVDTFFEWFNAVPSKVLNRQPFFNQSYGARLALDYMYGTSEFRQAMDAKAASSQDFANTLAVGQRKIFRDKGITKYPPAFERVDDYTWDPVRQLGEPDSAARYDEAIQAGHYDRVPLTNDPEAFVSQALFDALEQIGTEADGMKTRGTYITTSQGIESASYTSYPNLLFSGSSRVPVESWMTDFNDLGQANIVQSILAQATQGMPSVEDVSAAAAFLSTPGAQLTREAMTAAGVGADVVDSLLVHPSAMARLRDVVTLAAGGEMDDTMKAAAAALGWRDMHRTGGIAHWPDRTLSYGGYIDIFRIDHMPQYLQDLVAREGDIEQLTTLAGGRYPLLEKVDGFSEAFNEVRQETGLFGRTRRTTGQTADVQIRGEQAIRKRIESKIGRELSTSEQMEFQKLWGSNASKWKHVTNVEGLEPAARLPEHIVRQLNERGIMVSSNRQVGDVALLFDEHTQGVHAQAAIMGDTTPLDVAVTDLPMNRDALLGAMSDRPPSMVDLSKAEWADPIRRKEIDDAWRLQDITTELEANHRVELWHKTLNFEPDSSGVYQRDWPNVPNKLEINAHNSAAYDALPSHFMHYGDEGPELLLDHGLWIENEQFRSVVTAFADDAAELDLRAGRYARLHGVVQADGSVSTAAISWTDEMEEFAKEAVALEYRIDAAREGLDWQGGVSISPGGDSFPWEPYQMMDRWRKKPDAMFKSIEQQMREFSMMVDSYNESGSRILIYESTQELGELRDFNSNWDGFNLKHLEPKPETVDMLNNGGNIDVDFRGVPNDERNEAVRRMFGRIDDQQYDRGADLGPVRGSPDISLSTQDELDVAMKTAKFEAIEETKEVFYDLANKSNVADAYKFVFPFGDAWYEVLSRWAHIMNPVEQGGQPLRNVRRVQQTFNAGRQSGYISTNEYGEEVFNWPLAPGMMSNMFIPDSSNVSLQSVMPVSSLMFIDPSARGVGAPGTSPIWQLSVQFLAPYTEGVPLLHDTLQWLTYGDKTQYRPGEIDELDDVMQGFVPTVMNRMAAWMFDEQARETLGTTKLRLFQSLGMSGDPNYDFMTQEGGRRAWDTANAAGTWLSWFRIMDAWMMPGQPQYSVKFNQPDPLAAIPDFTFDEMLDEVGRLDWRQQVPVLSAVRLAAEYRHAREMFGDAEADLYMIQRHGVLPAMLQSASAGLVERPVSWGGVEHVNDNLWLKDVAPYTLAATVPADADDTFHSGAWNNLFSEFLEIEGVENKPIRSKRSPSEFIQAVQRSVGYDQLRYQQALYDRAVQNLRDGYGESYASNHDYRWKKKQLEQILRDNKDSIYTEFSIVRGSNQGAVVGSVESVTLRMLVDEIIQLGTPGTNQYVKFKDGLPQLSEVAEQYATWFTELEMLSRQVDEGTASSEWWINGESDQAEFLRKSVAQSVQRYYSKLTDPNQIAYAKWLNDRLMDDLLVEWEWIDRSFAPELQSFPSVWKSSTLSINPSEVTP